jgi:hypothetical protein
MPAVWRRRNSRPVTSDRPDRSDTGTEQHPAHGRRGHRDAQAGEFALDALVAPTAVLASETDKQVAPLRIDRWGAPVPDAERSRVEPEGGDASPARSRRDHEDVPVRPGEDATRRGEEDAVRVAELRSAPLAPQGDELGAQHHDLRGPGSAGTGTAASLEDATHQHVDDRHDQDLRTVDEAQTLETRLPPVDYRHDRRRDRRPCRPRNCRVNW